MGNGASFKRLGGVGEIIGQTNHFWFGARSAPPNSEELLKAAAAAAIRDALDVIDGA